MSPRNKLICIFHTICNNNKIDIFMTKNLENLSNAMKKKKKRKKERNPWF